MIGSKTELNARIYKDWVDKSFAECKEKSFIVGYFRDKKEAEILSFFEVDRDFDEVLSDVSKKKDKYVILGVVYKAFQENLIDEKTCREQILNLRKIKGKAPARLYKADFDIKKEYELFSKSLLYGCVDDFFRNSGVRDKADKLRKEIYTDPIEMMNCFEKYDSAEGQNDRKQDSKEYGGKKIDNNTYREECNKLYRELNNKNYTDGFIPIEIDSESGLGIYMIGRDELNENTLRKFELNGVQASFFYCVLVLIGTKSSVERTLINMMYDIAFVTSKLSDAFCLYSTILKEGKAFKKYRKMNCEISPREVKSASVPPFDKYFATLGDESVQPYSEEEKNVIADSKAREDARMRKKGGGTLRMPN